MTTLANKEVKRDAQIGDHENQIYELTEPRRYSAQGLAEMAQPSDEPAAGAERFYAVARIDAVESTGPRARQGEELWIVLYANEDVTQGLEVTFYPRVTAHEDVPRVKHIDSDEVLVGTVSSRTRERYERVIENHRMVESGEVHG